MSPQDDDQQGLALGLVFGIVALVVASVIGLGIYQRNKSAASAGAPVATAVKTPVGSSANATLPSAGPAVGVLAAAPATAQNALDAASVKVENGVVKFYFAPGKTDLALGANDALTQVIAASKGGKKLLISGYHDATGSAVKNAEIAKMRAFAVRDVLKNAGVPDDRIELKKPEQLTGVGSNAEARRVEVALQ